MVCIKRSLRVVAVLALVGSATHAQQITFSSDSTKTVQQAPPPPLVKLKAPKVKPILHEMSFGMRLNTNGWSFFTDYGKAKPADMKKADMFYNLVYLQAEFTEKKDPKEQKVATQTLTNKGSSNYIYGKINNFYALKLGAGFRKLIAGKPDPGCVSIHWANTLGFSLGMQKPYYVVVSGSNAIKYSDVDKDDFLNRNVIRGAGGFSKGLGEMVFIPGGHVKSALHFDFSTNRKNVLGVEAGVNAEFYSQPIALMANEKTVTNFIDLFVSFQYGRRW